MRLAVAATVALFSLSGCGLLLDADPRPEDRAPFRDAAIADAPADAGYDAISDAVADSGCTDGSCSTCPTIERRLTTTDEEETDAKITLANGGFVVAWDGDLDGESGTVLRGIDVDGTTRWELLVSDPARDPSLASTGARVALAVAGEGVVRLFDRDPMTGSAVVEHSLSYASGDVAEPDVMITVDGWASAWVETISAPNPQVVFGTLDATGTVGSAPMVLSNGINEPDVPNVAQVGDLYMVVWDENTASPPGHYAFFRNGDSPMVRTFGVSSDDAFVRANGTDFATVWIEHDGPNRPVIQLFDGAGTARAPMELATDDMYRDEPDAAWSGESWGVVYEEGSASATDAVIQLVVVSADATTILGRAQVSHGSAFAQEAAVAWSGSGWGVVWEDVRDGNSEIYYAHLCP
jgi:hypothetical protein